MFVNCLLLFIELCYKKRLQQLVNNYCKCKAREKHYSPGLFANIFNSKTICRVGKQQWLEVKRPDPDLGSHVRVFRDPLCNTMSTQSIGTLNLWVWKSWLISIGRWFGAGSESSGYPLLWKLHQN